MGQGTYGIADGRAETSELRRRSLDSPVADVLARFRGRWQVVRVSGLLPPVGVTKRIAGDEGCTYLFGVPIGRFHIEAGRPVRFVYRFWPIVDELDVPPDGPSAARGRGLVFGHVFCRFALRRR
jgi:hypothetical protein